MISVSEAEEIIREHTPRFPALTLPLAEAAGRVLREDVVADRDLPPFNRVCMDGIAIAYAAWERGLRQFPVAAMQRAGEPMKTLADDSSCMEIMTGAVLPENCDCVIRYEDLTIESDTAVVLPDLTLAAMENIHVQGKDRTAGDTLMPEGTRLHSPEIAVLASVGKADVAVDREPVIAIIGTGDELVAVDETVAPHQIRQSNGHAVRAALLRSGYSQTNLVHLLDDAGELQRELAALLDSSDVLVLSGGVSMGKFDLIPEIMDVLGVGVRFHRVSQRPGMPFWFGVRDTDGAVVFALPGNPVSTLMCFHRYVLPCLRRAAGDTDTRVSHTTLAEPVTFKKALTWFLPVQMSAAADEPTVAKPMPTSGSGDFAALAGSDGFVELPLDQETFPAGMTVPYFAWQ